jgi:NADP-dependent 3-hydroxy acid dehydrogenase YdfG
LQRLLYVLTLAGGLIGSHCVEVFLAAGYKVRGVARSASKLAYLKARWDKIYGVGAFEIAVVNDFTKDGAFDDALKGVPGFCENSLDIYKDYLLAGRRIRCHPCRRADDAHTRS